MDALFEGEDVVLISLRKPTRSLSCNVFFKGFFPVLQLKRFHFYSMYLPNVFLFQYYYTQEIISLLLSDAFVFILGAFFSFGFSCV